MRAWSNAVNSGDNEAAAALFAPGARVIQRRVFVLDTEEKAVAFHAALPCAGEITKLESKGDTVTATFRLADRESSWCDAPGARARTRFRVRDGKIVRWEQLPARTRAPGEPT